MALISEFCGWRCAELVGVTIYYILSYFHVSPSRLRAKNCLFSQNSRCYELDNYKST